MAERFNGRVALVTGGSLGIGRATVLALAREGADVAFTYSELGITPTNRSRRRRREKAGQPGAGAGIDVACYDEATRVVGNVCEEFGRIDILVNNAGINRDGVL